MSQVLVHPGVATSQLLATLILEFDLESFVGAFLGGGLLTGEN